MSSCAAVALCLVSVALADVHPKDFVTVNEVVSPKRSVPLTEIFDKRSNIQIVFDTNYLQQNLTNHGDRVEMRVEASVQRKDGKKTPIAVDNFISVEGEGRTFKYVFHDKLYENVGGAFPNVLPDSFLFVSNEGLKDGDVIYIKITDIETQSDVNYVTTAGKFGWNSAVIDSFFLLRRKGVTDSERQAGINDVNYRPAPGMTHAWVFSPRKRGARFLQPGFGYNVSFTDWNDPSFDAASGQFIDTDANKIEITAGLTFSLFDNALQFTYGWNLNVEQDRRYFGVGFSFFRLADKITTLVKK